MITKTQSQQLPWLGMSVPMKTAGPPSLTLFVMALVFAALNVVLAVMEKERFKKRVAALWAPGNSRSTTGQSF